MHWHMPTFTEGEEMNPSIAQNNSSEPVFIHAITASSFKMLSIPKESERVLHGSRMDLASCFYGRCALENVYNKNGLHIKRF
jgi:hypothetical protein